MKNTVTAFKSGNSIALRANKAFVSNNDIKVGKKYVIREIKEEQSNKKQDIDKIIKAFQELQKINAFADIKDPVAWQREIRKDRPLPGRE